MVEACLNNTLLQYRTVQRDPMIQCHPVIWTHALVRPNYKLNCVWCTVELKGIGNLECRIKFYREKNRGTSCIQLNILILQLTVHRFYNIIICKSFLNITLTFYTCVIVHANILWRLLFLCIDSQMAPHKLCMYICAPTILLHLWLM